MKWILLFTLLVCVASSQAQTLQKCSSHGGVTAYRSGSCLEGETLVAVRDASPDVGTAEQSQALREHQAHRPAVAKRSSARTDADQHTSRRVSAGTPRRRTSGNDRCRTTKQARDDFERRRSIKITMAELSRWNHRVYEACK